SVNCEVLIAKQVPQGVLLLEAPKPTLYLESRFAELPDDERRFLLGRAFECLRGGYGLLLRVSDRERQEVVHLLDQLGRAEADRDAAASEFSRNIPRKLLRSLERLQTGVSTTPVSWYAALQTAANRGGLLACDDVGAAVRMLARLSGDELA